MTRHLPIITTLSVLALLAFAPAALAAPPSLKGIATQGPCSPVFNEVAVKSNLINTCELSPKQLEDIAHRVELLQQRSAIFQKNSTLLLNAINSGNKASGRSIEEILKRLDELTSDRGRSAQVAAEGLSLLNGKESGNNSTALGPHTGEEVFDDPMIVVHCDQLGTFTIYPLKGYAYEGQVMVYVAPDIFGLYYYRIDIHQLLRLYINRVDGSVGGYALPMTNDEYRQFSAETLAQVASQHIDDPVQRGRTYVADGDQRLGGRLRSEASGISGSCEKVKPRI